MTAINPIVPSPEQVDLWFDDAVRLNSTPKYYIARQAALWSADQELEACVEWLGDAPVVWNNNKAIHPGSFLRAARRPEPLSLRKQAYDALDTYIYGALDPKDKERAYNTIRRALEALPND